MKGLTKYLIAGVPFLFAWHAIVDYLSTRVSGNWKDDVWYLGGAVALSGISIIREWAYKKEKVQKEVIIYDGTKFTITRGKDGKIVDFTLHVSE